MEVPILHSAQCRHLRGRKSGPLFVHENGSYLTRGHLVSWMRDAMSHLGLNGNLSGHSFRIGAATTPASVGILDHLITTMGRWLSDVYQMYIRTPLSVIDSVAGHLAS